MKREAHLLPTLVGFSSRYSHLSAEPQHSYRGPTYGQNMTKKLNEMHDDVESTLVEMIGVRSRLIRRAIAPASHSLVSSLMEKARASQTALVMSSERLWLSRG